MGKKGRKRVAKEERRNLRLWAEGARESVLAPHIPAYTDALDRNWRDERDYLQKVCNEFHAQFSWRLEDHEEPDLPLPEYDLRVPAPVESLDEEETKQKRARVELLNDRIRRWLKYCARKLRKTLRPKLDPRKDLWAILLAKLSGFKCPPKARQAYQQFMRETYQTDIAPIVAERWAAKTSEGSNMQTAKQPTGAFRAEIARELFAQLPESERNRYQQAAKDEGAEARRTYDENLKNTPSRTPEDCQKCIDEVGNFLGPLLQGILECTGLHSVVLLGGPIPKYGGELKTVYVSYGRNKTVGGQHFPQWAGERWDRQVTDLMKEYLETAFSASDIAEAALQDPLDAAKYTMDNDSEPEAQESCSSDSDSDSDSNAESDDTDVPLTKKRKTTHDAKGKRKEKAAPAPATRKKKLSAPDLSNLTIGEIIEKTLKAPGITVTSKSMAPAGLTYTQMREWNIARNKILLQPLEEEIRGELEEIGVKKKATPAKKRSAPKEAEDGPAPPARKLRRLNPGTTEPSTPAASSTQPAPPSTPQPAPPPLSVTAPPSTQSAPSSTPQPTPPLTQLTSSMESAPAPAPLSLQPAPSSTPQPTPPLTQSASLMESASPPTSQPAPLPSCATAPSSTQPALPSTPQPAPPASSATAPPSTQPVPSSTTQSAPPPLSATAPPASGMASRAKHKGKGGAATATRPAVTVEVPGGALRWITDSVAWLSTQDLGCHYTALLAALVKLETVFGFDEETYGVLPSEGWPVQLHDWIRTGRTRSKKIPVVLDVAKYADEWQGWWDSLQPEWRTKTRNGKWMVGGDASYGGNAEWGVLDRPGPNGCLSVVASLYFWGVCEQPAVVKERWMDSVQDVSWILEGLTASMGKVH